MVGCVEVGFVLVFIVLLLFCMDWIGFLVLLLICFAVLLVFVVGFGWGFSCGLLGYLPVLWVLGFALAFVVRWTLNVQLLIWGFDYVGWLGL